MTAETPPVDLDAIRARAKASLREPWDADGNGVFTPHGVCVATTHRALLGARLDDARFIAHAREDIPALLGMVDTLTERCERLDAERLSGMDHGNRGWMTALKEQGRAFDAERRVDTLTAALESIASADECAICQNDPRVCLRHQYPPDVARAALAGTSPTPPTMYDELMAAESVPMPGLAAAAAHNPTPPTPDLAALADQWDAEAAAARKQSEWQWRDPDQQLLLRTKANKAEACAAELRAALGVPRSAGHKEDPVRTATPGTVRQTGEGNTNSATGVWPRHDPVGGAPTTEPGTGGLICDTCGEGEREAAPGVIDRINTYNGNGSLWHRHTSCSARAMVEERPRLMQRLAELEAAERDPDTTGGDA